MSEHVLREAVAARLREHEARGLGRVNVEVSGEQVTLFLRGGRLHERCTCGTEACDHVRVALALCAGASEQAAPSDARPPPSQRPLDASLELDGLAGALDALCLAVVRAGLAHPDSPSIQQALAGLIDAAPVPLPLALARFVGRLQSALSRGDVAASARLLDAALAWSGLLRSDSDDPAARRYRSLLFERRGTPGGVLADVRLLELAREWLAGLDRASIERRYLIDLATGDSFAEERLRGGSEGSVGPCPRLLHVDYAELDPELRPPRVRLLQYTLTLSLPADAFARVVDLAERDVSTLRSRYLDALADAPALAEPLALFAPRALEDGDRGVLRDVRGELLALTDEQGSSASAALRAAAAGAEIACVVGRLVGGDRGLALRPLAAVVRRGDAHELRRVT